MAVGARRRRDHRRRCDRRDPHYRRGRFRQLDRCFDHDTGHDADDEDGYLDADDNGNGDDHDDTAPINITRSCTVNNIAGVVGGSTVANVNATDVPASQTALASCAQASSLVKGVAQTQAEMPVTVEGFACTPSVSGSTAKWTCVLNGADSALTITTKFPLTYTD